MQVIPIIWPILACAFLTGILLGWVLFVALPRMRRVERQRALRTMRRGAIAAVLPPEASVVDTDQQACPAPRMK